MNLKIFLSTVPMISFIIFGLLYITNQNVDAFDDYGIRFIAYLDPYQIVSEAYMDHDLDSHGIVYLSIDPFFGDGFYSYTTIYFVLSCFFFA